MLVKASSFNVDNLNPFNPELEHKDTASVIRNKLTDLLTELRGFTFLKTLFIELKKQKVMMKQNIPPFILTQKIIINQSNINDVFKSIYTMIISNTQKDLGKNFGLIIDSVVSLIINFPKCIPLAGSSYIKLPKELDNSKNGLININTINDKECF